MEGLSSGIRQARPFLTYCDPSVLLCEAKSPFRDVTTVLDGLKREPLGRRKGEREFVDGWQYRGSIGSGKRFRAFIAPYDRAR